MGNGFTFQLETLIFYSIAWAVCKYLHVDVKNVSVYGDDVIIPCKAFEKYVEVCAFYGFTVNKSKSYTSSSCFRESCGSHFFSGVNCKPYFLKEVIVDDLACYKVANGIRRLSHNPDLGYCDARFYTTWLTLRNAVKRPKFIPEFYGDGGFIVNFDEAKPFRAKYNIEGYFTKHVAAVPLKYSSDDHPVLLARLKGRSVDLAFRNETNLRGRVKQVTKRLFVNQWYFLGEWI